MLIAPCACEKETGNCAHTYIRAQHVYVQKMLVTCFSFMLCIIRSLLFLTSLNHAWACERVCRCSFIRRTLAHSFSIFGIRFYLLPFAFAPCVFVSLSLDFHHTELYTTTLHVGFIVLVRPVLWIFVWARDLPVCCVIASVLVENTNPTSTETQRFFSDDEIL